MPWIEALRPSDRLAKLTASARPKQDADWYRIRNLGQDEAEILLYDEIGWYGTEAEQFVRDLRDVQASRLTVRVNSPGGSVFDGIAIANALRAHPAAVTVQVDGIAASIASVIAMSGDRLVMGPNSMLMVHDASGMCMGNGADMLEMAALLDKISDNIAGAYAEKAGGTVEAWRAVMRAETWYLPQEAVDAGLADELLLQRPPAQEPDEPAMTNSWDLSVFRYAGREEAPAPEPVAVAEPSLTISIEGAVDEDLVARLRAAVQTPAAEPVPVVEPEPVVVPEPVATLEPQPETPGTEPEPEDAWAQLTAHLTQREPDPWAALTAHLTETTSASSAATEA